MKLTAAFVAAALAASRVHGLPIADSAVGLVEARSEFKLNGEAMLQAAKRGTDTDLLTRRLDHAGKAQQILFARDSGELKTDFVPQRKVLVKRAPVFTLDGAIDGVKSLEEHITGALAATKYYDSAYQNELKIYEKGGLSDDGELLQGETEEQARDRKTRLREEWYQSDEGRQQGKKTEEARQSLVDADKKHRFLEGLKNPKQIRTFDHSAKLRTYKLKAQMDLEHERLMHILQVHGSEPNDPLHAKALEEAQATYRVTWGEWMRSQGEKLSDSDVEKINSAKEIVARMKAREAAEREQSFHFHAAGTSGGRA